jgi:hypothetical protein
LRTGLGLLVEKYLAFSDPGAGTVVLEDPGKARVVDVLPVVGVVGALDIAEQDTGTAVRLRS